MTESLADGPDWHLRSDFVLAFHFSPLWTNGAALRSMNSIGSILEDKVPIMTHLDLQKRFPIYHVCPKCLAALLCGSAFLQNGLAFLQELDAGGNDTGRGISTAN